MERWERALEWAVNVGDAEEQQKICNVLGRLCLEQGEYRKALSWHVREVSICEELMDAGGVDARLYVAAAIAWRKVGEANASLGRVDDALAAHLRQLEMARRSEDLREVQRAQVMTSNGYRLRGEALRATDEYVADEDFQRAYDHAADALAIASDLAGLKLQVDSGNHSAAVGEEEDEMVTISLIALGSSLDVMGKHKQAVEQYKGALGRARRRGDHNTEALVLNNVAQCYVQMEDLARAEKYASKDVEISERLGVGLRLALAYNSLGDVQFRLFKYHEAERSFEKSLEQFMLIKDESVNRESASNNLGMVGEAIRSQNRIHQLLEQATFSMNWRDKSKLHKELALEHSSLSQFSSEADHWKHRLDILKEHQDPSDLQSKLDLCETLSALSVALENAKDPASALTFCRQDLEHRTELQDTEGRAASLCQLGNILESLGDPGGAIQAYKEARELAQDSHALAIEINVVENLEYVYRKLQRTEERDRCIEELRSLRVAQAVQEKDQRWRSHGDGDSEDHHIIERQVTNMDSIDGAHERTLLEATAAQHCMLRSEHHRSRPKRHKHLAGSSLLEDIDALEIAVEKENFSEGDTRLRTLKRLKVGSLDKTTHISSSSENLNTQSESDDSTFAMMPISQSPPHRESIPPMEESSPSRICRLVPEETQEDIRIRRNFMNAGYVVV